MTDKECEYYYGVIKIIIELDSLENEAKKEKKKIDKEKRENLLKQKKELQELLQKEIYSHKDKVRKVNIKTVIDNRLLEEPYSKDNYPEGIKWKWLRQSKKIAEFESCESRAMGVKQNEVTYDKIILNWKSIDILHQVVLNGFYMSIIDSEDNIVTKHYSVITASAGQLRTDAVQCVEDNKWKSIEQELMCGLTWDKINAKGGVNLGKFLAYNSLPSGATDEWKFDIDQCIVIKDFENNVPGLMDYIDEDYKIERGVRAEPIKHSDGIGMVLPGTLPGPEYTNAMLRGPWIKGLLTTFDFIDFCKKNNVKPVIKDIYGLEHDLEKENIRVIFCESQFKMSKFYDSWDEYKTYFKKYGCHLCLTNYEEPYIRDTTINYQMLQTLTDMSDEEIDAFVKPAQDRINNIATDRETMLRTLGAKEDGVTPYSRALYMYPALLRDGYARETLKAIKTKMVFEAKSGAIKCRNKRLFAIPDMYACCERWFLGKENPGGILNVGHCFSKLYLGYEEADVLRSPHLYCEHSIQKFDKSDACKYWFRTNGIYTSCHDLISRILQFDVDGDMLNVVTDEYIISAAKRTIQNKNVIPLYYDAHKADPEILTRENMFFGIKRAHDYSGIGAVSNSLTKLWNKENPSFTAAAFITKYNNYVIDGAKTGFVNSYDDHEESKQIVHAAIGGQTSRLPHFFQFSKNGRHNSKSNSTKHKSYSKPNNSTMNKICSKFSTKTRINMNFDDIELFNWRMLLHDDNYDFNENYGLVFCALDTAIGDSVQIGAKESERDEYLKFLNSRAMFVETVKDKLKSICPLDESFPSVTEYLFTKGHDGRMFHKQLYWEIYGDIAEKNLKDNLSKYSLCENCGAKIPNFEHNHICNSKTMNVSVCIDCGRIIHRTNPKQQRCPDCQSLYRKTYYKTRIKELCS